jgi:hypothetical protein
MSAVELGCTPVVHLPRCLVDVLAADMEAAKLRIDAQLAQLRFRLSSPMDRLWASKKGRRGGRPVWRSRRSMAIYRR